MHLSPIFEIDFLLFVRLYSFIQCIIDTQSSRQFHCGQTTRLHLINVMCSCGACVCNMQHVTLHLKHFEKFVGAVDTNIIITCELFFLLTAHLFNIIYFRSQNMHNLFECLIDSIVGFLKIGFARKPFVYATKK